MIGDLIVGIVMHMTGISLIDVLAHIRMIWETEMANRQKIRDVKGEPIYGTVVGDEPPQPPPTKFAYNFQLNTKHGISLHRAVYLFDSFSRRAAHRFDRYLVNMYNIDDREIKEFEWHFLYHLAEIVTRNDFWEVYTELEATNLQST